MDHTFKGEAWSPSKAVSQLKQNKSKYCNIFLIQFRVWIFYICASDRFIFKLEWSEKRIDWLIEFPQFKDLLLKQNESSLKNGSSHFVYW